MNRIERKFSDLRKQGRSAFIAFITAGYPDLRATERLVPELARRGADIIELGIPFSDPLADGPLIQDASAHALKKGASLPAIFALAARIRAKTDVPLCFMTYYNPVFIMGEDKFAVRAAACGVDGVIVPDLPVEEGGTLSRACASRGVDLISFVSPTTAAERLGTICGRAAGFIYYVSLAGVTGPRQRLPRDLRVQVERVKAVTKKPVCVGFGVSSAEQVRDLSRFTDGVIVGSAIIRAITRSRGKPGMVESVGRFVERMAKATRR